MAAWLGKPVIALPRFVTLSLLCVPCWVVLPWLIFRGWVNNSPSQLAGLAGMAIGLLVALFFSGVGIALAFNHALATNAAIRARLTALLALVLNTIPWAYVLVAALLSR
jgi:hypothetical protein